MGSMSASDLLAHGRQYLLSRAPYLRRLVSRTVMVPDERIATLGVSDKMILVYNPDYLKDKNYREVGALLLHEMMHLAHTVVQSQDLLHVPRPLLNQAADLHINSLAREDGWILPPDGLFPEQFGFPPHLTTLEYLKLLEKNQTTLPSGLPKKGESSQQDQENLESSSSEEAGEEGGRKEEGEETSEDTKGFSVPSATTQGCTGGKCYLQGELAEEMEARYGRSREDLKQTVLEVSKAMQAHRRQIGTVSLGAQWLLNYANLPESKEDWKSVLRSWVLGYLGVGDNKTLTSYAKPHRRSFLGGDILLPGAYSEVPDLVIVVDTSGSMDPPLLHQCMIELAGILVSLNLQDVELVCADTRICSRQRVSFEDLYHPVPMEGGGGTDFDAPIREIAATGGCGLLVYLTDGYGVFPKQKPPFPVVWACFTDASFPPHEAVVRITPH